MSDRKTHPMVVPMLWLAVIVLALLVLGQLIGCAHSSTNHKKKLLEQMNPGCEVSDELELNCGDVP